MITLSPALAASDSNQSKLLSSSQNGGRIRDVSFSSYLDGAEETSILKLTSEEKNIKSHNPKCHENHDLYLVSNRAEEDNEIDVFNADKYFNGQGDDEEEEEEEEEEEDEISPGFDNKGIHQNQNTNPELELYEMKRLIQSAGTPSISSKSSLNSRSSLLLQSIPQKTNSRSSKKSFFSKLGCNCNDKNSVNVIDGNHLHQLGITITSSSNCSSGRRRQGKTGDFSNMIGHQDQTKSCAQKELQSRKIGDPGIEITSRGGEDFMFPMIKSKRQEEDDCARKSLEVFGTDVQRSRNMSGLSVERRLNMLTWDGTDIEIPSKSTRLYNDSDSDASSDLFEIESFSTNPSQYFTTQTSDAMSRTTGYAPSEASIDWSVVTASATDFAVMSDSEVLRTNSSRIRTRDYGTHGKNSPCGGKSKRHSSILSGCYSHKAVMVVSDSYRTCEQVLTPRH